LAPGDWGWECWCDGMEVSQFTYFQQVAGVECAPVAGELTYGLERLACYLQGVDSIMELNFNGGEGAARVSYKMCSCRQNKNTRAMISRRRTRISFFRISTPPKRSVDACSSSERAMVKRNISCVCLHMINA